MLIVLHCIALFCVMFCCIVLRCIVMHRNGPECYAVFSFFLSCLVFLSCKVFLHVQKYTSVDAIKSMCHDTVQLMVLDFVSTEFDFMLRQDGVKFHPYLITTGNTGPNNAANQNNVQPQHEEIQRRPSQEIFGGGRDGQLFFLPLHT